MNAYEPNLSRTGALRACPSDFQRLLALEECAAPAVALHVRTCPHCAQALRGLGLLPGQPSADAVRVPKRLIDALRSCNPDSAQAAPAAARVNLH